MRRHRPRHTSAQSSLDADPKPQGYTRAPASAAIASGSVLRIFRSDLPLAAPVAGTMPDICPHVRPVPALFLQVQRPSRRC